MANFKQNGIDITHLVVSEKESTGTAMITVEESGENHVIVIPGANATVDVAQVDSAQAILKTCKIVVCQNEINFQATAHSLTLARSLNSEVITVFNPSPWEVFERAFYASVDVLVVNQTELEDLLQSAAVPADASAEALQQKCAHILSTLAPSPSQGSALHRGIQCLVVTLGKDGAFFLTRFEGDHGTFVPGVALRSDEVVDSTGAGDCFLAALCVGLVKHQVTFTTERKAVDNMSNQAATLLCSIEKSVKRACEIAAESVKVKGCQASYQQLSY